MGRRDGLGFNSKKAGGGSIDRVASNDVDRDPNIGKAKDLLTGREKQIADQLKKAMGG